MVYWNVAFWKIIRRPKKRGKSFVTSINVFFSVWSQLMFQNIHKICVYPTSALYVAFIRKHSNTWADFSCWFWNRIKSAHRNKVPLNQANIDQNKRKIWQKQRDHTKMHAVFSTFMALFSLHHQIHFDWTFVIPDNKLIFFYFNTFI